MGTHSIPPSTWKDQVQTIRASDSSSEQQAAAAAVAGSQATYQAAAVPTAAAMLPATVGNPVAVSTSITLQQHGDRIATGNAARYVSTEGNAAVLPYHSPAATHVSTTTAAAAAIQESEDEDQVVQQTLRPSDLGMTDMSTSGLELQSAYFAARGNEPPVTNKHPSFTGCLDYLWFTPHHLEVLGHLAMPYETLGYNRVSGNPDAVAFASIPNAVWPSDHLAVGGVFRLGTGT